MLNRALFDSHWLSLAHSGSLSISLLHIQAHFDSVWPTLAFSALIGSQGPCSAQHVVAAWPQFSRPGDQAFLDKSIVQFFSNLIVIRTSQTGWK